MEMFSYLLATGITTGALYALVALGIVVVYKATGVVNFAHGEMFMLGGFMAFTFHVMFGWPYLASLVLAVIGAFVLGIVVDRVAFRPLMQRQSLVSVLLAMVGLSFVLKGVARWLWGGKGDFLTFPPLVSPEPILFGGIMIMSQQLVVVGAAVAVMLVFVLFFRLTRAGRFMQATADNPKAAKLVGLRTDRVYMYTFAVGAAVAGAAAVLMAPLTMLYPDIGFALFIKAFAAAVLGGLTSITGAIVGGLLIGIIEQLSAGYIDTGLQEVAAFIVIMVVMVFLPTGLFGQRAGRRV
ncbi:branched-chain amino acid transport system permease protein [Constrictibacter sp. MBR-5]|jgi:branched-chain amino acid transport system permease protein|uniref:branched-chain amino acid ABC transporter permease n=1 Tax=Constrictibacter sp. MBR-5 TaxID=3156467 RepID=UPI0033949032